MRSKFYPICKFIALTVLSVFRFADSSLAQAPYCAVSYTNPCANIGSTDFIQSFSTSGGATNISNLGTGCGNSGPNYVYYSTMNHTAVQGNTVNFSVVNNPTYGENFKMWVDWNHDFDFLDAGEQVYSGNYLAGATINGSFVVPLTATPAVTRMRIRNNFSNATFTSCSAEAWGEAEDYNFTVVAITPCSGTPTATITANTTTWCPATTVTLAYNGPLVNGLTYQWQSAPACSNTFTNITGATNSSYAISSLAATTQYRLIVTCTSSTLTATSSTITVSTVCYCNTCVAASTARDDIGQVTIGTFTNPATVGALTSNPASNAVYTNYTALGPILVSPGGSYPIEITQIEQFATWYTCYLKAYVDFNIDGDFTDPGEMVYDSPGPTVPTAPAFSGSFTVPATAAPGLTRMRIVLSETLNGGSIFPCSNYSWGETEDYTILIQPTISATSNGPVCAGNTLNLFGTTNATCAIYSWTGPNTFSSNLQNPSIPNATTAASGDYILTVISNGSAMPPDTITVAVNPPVNSNTNVILCNGDTIMLGTQVITSAGTYNGTFQTAALCDSIVTLNVTMAPVPAAPAVTSPVTYCQGATATPLTATGSGLLWYTTPTGGVGNPTAPTPSTVASTNTFYYVSQNVGGCESARAAILVTVNPTPVISSTSFTNPTTCGGTNGTITLNGLFVNTPYSISYSLNGGPATVVTISSGGSGSVVITGLSAGTYTDITATLNSCISASAGPVTLSAPPTPVIASTSSTNPTTCLGTNGTIMLNGLTANSTFVVNYTDDGTPVGPVNFNSNGLGVLTITGLNAGLYADIVVTLNGCPSAPAGPITLSDPLPPAAPVASNNGTLCTGNTLNLSASAIPGATYAWTGPSTFISGVQNPTLPNVQLVNAGVYSVTATVNNCTSIASTTTLAVNPTPVITSTSFTNPTTCGGTDGTLTINGLTANTSYTINYNLGAVPQAAVTATSTGTGAITLTGLGAGTYSGITATLNGCTSAAAGPVIISNPSAPATPVISNNGPLCVGSTLNLTSSLIAGATYSWSGPGTFNSGAQNPSVANVQLSDAGTYSVFVTVNNCNSGVAATNVVVNPIPATPVPGSNTPVCQGTTLSLTASTVTGASYAWTGPNIFNSGLQNPLIANVPVAAAGTYSVTATIAGCTSPAATTQVVVHPTPANPGVTNIDICQFATAGPLSATGQDLLWYTTPTGGTGSVTAPTPSTLLPGPQTWYVSQTINGCEGNRAAITANIIAKPAAPTAVASIFYCQNQTATALAANGQNLLWYTTSTGGTGTSTAPVPSTASISNTFWYVSQTVNGCESDRTAIEVIVAFTPPVPVLSAGVVNFCQFGPSTPTLDNYVTGNNLSWYTLPAGGTGSTTTPAVNTAVPSSITYYIASVSGSCESPRVALEVNVIDKPAPPGVADITYCQFLTAVPLTATGQNLLWYTSPTGGTASTTPPTPQTSVVTNTNYYVSQTVNGCESDRAAITVTIISKPALPQVTASYTYCQFNTPVPLNAIGQNLTWYTQPTGGTGSTATPTPSTNVPGIFNWYVTQSIGGCEGDRAQITVTVNPKPAEPLINTPVLYCEGDAAVALTANGQNLLWYADSTGGTGSPFAPVPSTASVGTTYYYVSQTAINCESDRAMIMVTVNPRVEADITASKTVFCQYDTITIQDLAINPATAAWLWDFNGGTVISGSGNGPYQIRWNTAGTKVVRLLVSNLNCSAVDSITLVVKPSPNAEFDIQPDACLPDTVKVQAAFNSLTGTVYAWDFDGATQLGGTGPGYYKLTWPFSGEKYISLTITQNGCKSLPFLDTITVHEPPVIDIDKVSDADICSGDKVELGTPEIAGYTYTWSPERFFETNGRPVIEAAVQVTGFVYLHVTDEFGCKGKDSVFIQTKPCCNAFLPDAFTPNGDGRNDIFRVITEGHHQLSVFRIVNRWGQTVFETASETEGWDGTFQKIPQAMGSYFYYLKYRCSDDQVFEKKGEVMLIR